MATSKESPISRARSKTVKRNVVVQLARRTRIFSRAQLAEETGLSATTVTHIVRELIAEGYLAEVGAGESRGGRPQSMLEFQADAELVAIIDLHASRIEAVLVDWDGNPAAGPIVRPVVDLVEDMVSLIDELALGRESRVKAITVAIPGVASGRSGQVRLAPAIGLIDGQPLGDLLRSRIDLPVIVDNDVNLMVVGEHVGGAAQDLDDLLLVHIGDGGIGAALMIDGRVRQGASGVAGEIGFLPLGQTAPPVDGIGHFENEWSTEGIVRAAAALATPVTGSPIVRMLEERAGADLAAQRLLDTVLLAWAHAIVSAVCVLDPGRVLLSGEAAEMGQASLDRVAAEVALYAPGGTDVRIAAMGSRALLHGAARRAFDAHDSNTQQHLDRMNRS